MEVFDLTSVVNGKPDASLGRQIADCFRRTSCVIVKDPRVLSSDNDNFLNLMEKYFTQTTATKSVDARPDLHYQVGLTPEGVEIPEAVYDPSSLEKLGSIPDEDRPRIPSGPDPKCRYMWRIGARPPNTAFYEMNAAPVVPTGFPEWTQILDTWGNKLVDTLHTIAELLSLGLEIESLVEKMKFGPHLLAPTGVDLALHRELDTCIAGYHSDLNLLTIHGRARYPGLHIWIQNGKRIPVKLPDGCLLIQAGRQLERLTGGFIKAGMHEVVVSEATKEALEHSEKLGKCTWRVSSTLFGHVKSDEILEPMGKFKSKESEQSYPAIMAGDFVAQVLKKINLHKNV